MERHSGSRAHRGQTALCRRPGLGVRPASDVHLTGYSELYARGIPKFPLIEVSEPPHHHAMGTIQKRQHLIIETAQIVLKLPANSGSMDFINRGWGPHGWAALATRSH